MGAIEEIYGSSEYMRASTLMVDKKPHSLDVTITGVGTGEFQDGTRQIQLELDGDGPKFGLNKTNARTIASIHGEDPRDWVGKSITIFATKCEYQGKPTDCIRVKDPAVYGVQYPPPFPTQNAGAVPASDIPF